MHLFHKWQEWHVIKTTFKEKFWQDYTYQREVHVQYYEIHERRVCDKCGRVEYRIRNSP